MVIVTGANKAFALYKAVEEGVNPHVDGVGLPAASTSNSYLWRGCNPRIASKNGEVLQGVDANT